MSGGRFGGTPVWLEDVSAQGVGRIATTSVGCREFYWGHEEPLRRTDGTVAATDLGQFDADGNLYLDGRLDGGEKLHGVTIYPRQIERHLLGLGGVADVRVWMLARDGVDHLAARVVGSATEGQIRGHCASLAESSRPTLIECVSEEIATTYSSRGKL